MLYRHDLHMPSFALPSQSAQGIEHLRDGRDPQARALIDVSTGVHDLEEIEAFARTVRSRFSHFVVMGMGGSGLSGKALCGLQAMSQPVRLHVLDNIDPVTMDMLLATLPPERTAFLAISKSGSTVETLAQWLVFTQWARATLAAQSISERFFVVTEPGDSPLRAMARENGIAVFDHDARIGGRFSILTNVGLIPAAVAGLDIRALRQGAATLARQLAEAQAPEHFAPALGAAAHYVLASQGRSLAVFMPYCDRLQGFSAWLRQCWAESLGKQGLGITPIHALGATDQHSQLQLYLDGPRDKFFTFFLLKQAGLGALIPPPGGQPTLSYLKGRTIGDVFAATQRSTITRLVGQGQPVRAFSMERLDEHTLGALLMHMMLEIILLARLFGVDPFDQPAVEEGKRLARDYLLRGAL